MNDTTHRFLSEIAARVGAERVAELHLFPVLRQGGVECGVAVVAADPAEAAAAEQEPPPAPSRHVRHVVYTARYRHHLKGTERGRWECDVVEEAEAPLVTVEEVVRGVMRRSGESFHPERISGDQLRAIVTSPAAPPPVPA